MLGRFENVIMSNAMWLWTILVESTSDTGTRRKRHVVPHDSTTLLTQLRQEQLQRIRESRRVQQSTTVLAVAEFRLFDIYVH